MTHRHFLTAALAAAMLLTACASDDVPDTDDAVVEQPTADSTTGTDTSATEPPSDAGDAGDDTTGDDTADDDTADDATDDTTADAAGDTDDDTAEQDAAAGTQPAAVALTLDGRRVPIAAACNGVDGAVLATTEGEVTVTLVREAGTTLRYQGEGMTAETDEVEVEQVGASTVYRASLESEQVPAVDVELELGDTSALEDC